MNHSTPCNQLLIFGKKDNSSSLTIFSTREQDLQATINEKGLKYSQIRLILGPLRYPFKFLSEALRDLKPGACKEEYILKVVLSRYDNYIDDSKIDSLTD